MARDDPTEPIFVDARRKAPRPRSDAAAPPAGAPPASGRRTHAGGGSAAGKKSPRQPRAAARAAATTAPPPPTARMPRIAAGPGSAPAPAAPAAKTKAAPPKRRRRRRPPPFMRPGAPGAILMTGILAVIVAFVVTLVFAIVDASKPIQGVNTGSESEATVPPPPTIGDQTSTTRPPEVLTEDELAKRVTATIRGIQTRDEAGQPVTGTAFVVGSFGGQTLLLTSFDVVRANVRQPGPGITLDGGRQASLWTWQEDKDLALIVIGGTIESLPWATAAPKAGDKVWAAGAGQKLSAGVVLGTTESGVEHNIFVDDARQGAPLVNQRGEILALVSRVYNPDGRGTDALYTGIPIRAACDRVLRCGSGNTTPEGSNTGPTSTTPTATTRA